MQIGDQQIDQLDADERGDYSPYPVDQEIPAEESGCAYGAIGNASKSQGNQRNDDQSVEDYR
jgi:hypothetical protein